MFVRPGNTVISVRGFPLLSFRLFIEVSASTEYSFSLFYVAARWVVVSWDIELYNNVYIFS